MNHAISPPRHSPGKALNVVAWIAQVLTAGMFLFAGGSKLAGNPMMVATFEHIGLGQWFRILTGTLEVLGAVLLFVPRLAGAGALLLACVMVGAVATHLFVIGGSPVAALVLLASSLFIAWARKDRILALVGPRR